MFTRNYSEVDKKEIELKGFSADDFELLLTHVYGGSVSLTDNNAYRLLRISHYLNVKKLEDLCIDYIVKSYSIPLNTAVFIFMFSSRIGNITLLDEFKKRLAENFVDVSRNEKFLRVSGIELLNILEHPDLNADASTILDFLAHWVQFQSEDEKKLLPDLLSTVEQKVPNEWLAKTITEGGVSSNEPRSKKRKKKDEKSVTEHSSNGMKDEIFFDDEIDDIEDSSQNESNLPFILYTHDVRNGNEHFMNKYKLNGVNSLQLLESDRDPKIDYDLVEFCKFIRVEEIRMMVLIDRHYDDNKSNSEYSDQGSTSSRSSRRDSSRKFVLRPYVRYESENYAMKSCLSRPNVGEPDYCSATMATNGVKIYVYSAGEFLKFDCKSNKWTENEPGHAPVRTKYPNLLAHNDSLYMIGGESIRYYDDEVGERNGEFFQRYDLREGRWSPLPSMKYARSRSASCIHDDIIYVSGGEHLTYFKGCVECFDFRAGRWRVLGSSMPKPKMNHSLLVHDNRLWFFGGREYNTKYEKLTDLTWYSYDLKEGTWSDVFSVPKAYGKFATVRILDVVLEI
jgi:hypothetical protein